MRREVAAMFAAMFAAAIAPIIWILLALVGAAFALHAENTAITFESSQKLLAGFAVLGVFTWVYSKVRPEPKIAAIVGGIGLMALCAAIGGVNAACIAMRFSTARRFVRRGRSRDGH
jgi:apolipoprotein N-acyltransferase